jgi:hypothetical protein
VIYFQLFSVLSKQSANLGCILLFLTTTPLFYSLLVCPRNVKISTFSNIFLKSYFFVVLLQPFFKDNKQYGKIKNIGGDAGCIVLPH